MRWKFFVLWQVLPICFICRAIDSGCLHAQWPPEVQQGLHEADRLANEALLDRHVYYFHDDEDGRVLAAIELRLRNTASGIDLIADIHPWGPVVDPAPGFHTLAGINDITAMQLARIQRAAERFAIRIDAPGGPPVDADVSFGPRIRLPERRLESSGRIDYLGWSLERYPSRMTITATLSDNSQMANDLWIELFDSHRMRLRFGAFVENGGLQWMAFQDQQLPATQPRQPDFQPPQVAPHEPAQMNDDHAIEIDQADWASRDLEGKWMRFQRDADEEGARTAWYRFLRQQREFELLEWIALAERRGIAKEPGTVLIEEDAPQWVRVAVWFFGDHSSHGRDIARSILDNQPQIAIAWMRKYRDILEENVIQLLAELEQRHGDSMIDVDVDKYLGPLRREQVFRHLAAPAKLEDFGDRRTAAPDVVYVHQVLRAIRNLIAAGLEDDPHIGHLNQLARHDEIRVRQEALLAFTYLPANVIPVDDFIRMVHEDMEPDSIREAALLAFSYAQYPHVEIELMRLSTDPKHPAWNAALSRLGDLGDSFVLNRLTSIPQTILSESQARILEQAMHNIRQRVVTLDGTLGGPYRIDDNQRKQYVTRLLERSAWVDLECDPLETDLVPWTIAHFREPKRLEAFRELVANIGTTYEPSEHLKSHLDERTSAFQTRVREYAATILE